MIWKTVIVGNIVLRDLDPGLIGLIFVATAWMLGHRRYIYHQKADNGQRNTDQ
jgi:uncharacterized membrane-anchored protein